MRTYHCLFVKFYVCSNVPVIPGDIFAIKCMTKAELVRKNMVSTTLRGIATACVCCAVLCSATALLACACQCASLRPKLMAVAVQHLLLQVESAFNERTILATTDNPFIVRCYYWCVHRSRPLRLLVCWSCRRPGKPR